MILIVFCSNKTQSHAHKHTYEVCLIKIASFSGNTENDRKNCFTNKDSNTLLMTLVLILVSAGEVVLDDGGDELVQSGLAVISQPSSHVF